MQFGNYAHKQKFIAIEKMMKCDITRYLEYTIFTMISVIKIIKDHGDPYKDHASRIKDQTRHFKDHRRPK